MPLAAYGRRNELIGWLGMTSDPDDSDKAAAPSIAPPRAAFIFLFITVLLDMLALGIIVPVLPKLVVDLLAGDTARAAALMLVIAVVIAVPTTRAGVEKKA